MKGTTMVRKQERMTVLLVLGLVAAGPTRPCTAAAPEEKSAVHAVTAGELVVERPTLICLGFQWYTSGDANKNAQVTLQYRKLGEQAWKPALDPWRLCGQRCISYGGEAHDFYEPPQMFAGSIFDLQPDTQYECRLTMTDPDGVMGVAERTVRIKTRALPQPPADSRLLHLGGDKSDFRDFGEAVRALQPGDTLLIHRGEYRLAGRQDADYLDGNVYTLDLQGTPDRPITIQAAGDGEVVFDARGNYMAFDVQNAQHLILDGLTIKDADFAVYAGGTQPASNDGIVVRDCTFRNVKRNVQGFSPAAAASAGKAASQPAQGRVRHVGGPSVRVDGVAVNPQDKGRVFQTLGNALFGDDTWSKNRCGRASKRRNDLIGPGDTVVVHQGEKLLDHSKKSHWGPCYFYNSTIVLNLKGTPEKPITLRGEGNPVFDGVGNYKLFDVQGSEHLVIEGLTFHNADYALYKGKQTVRHPVVGLTVRRCRFENVGCGVYGISGGNREFLISDNVFVGRCKPQYADGERWQDDEASYSAVHLAGQGHVICHNDVSRFFDGLQLQSNWSTSPTVNTYWTAGGNEPIELRTSAVDIYNNVIHFTPDNSIETDMGHHNIRCMRNLCVDAFGGYWSNQFVMGGPAYWIRNIAYGAESGVFKNQAGPVGVYSLHNTAACQKPSQWPPLRTKVFATEWRENDKFIYAGDLTVNPGESAGLFAAPPVPGVKGVNPTQFRTKDFYPASDSPAVDRAIDMLPNINDDFAGQAPDLGAIEFGKPLPHFGPRHANQ